MTSCVSQAREQSGAGASETEHREVLHTGGNTGGAARVPAIAGANPAAVLQGRPRHVSK